MDGKPNDNERAVFDALVENGIITREWLGEKVEIMKKKKEQEILNNHPYSVYEYRGYWYTTVPDKVKGRRKIKKKKKEDLEQAIIDYYSSDPDDLAPTVKDIFTIWNEGRIAAGTAKGSTAIRDLRTYDKYISRTPLNNRPVSTISREEWTAFLRKNLPGKTAKEFGRLKGVVRGILQYAEDHLLITYSDEDVICKVRAPKNGFSCKSKNPEHEIYFSDELADLRQYCVDHPDPYTRCILLETLVRIFDADICQKLDRSLFRFLFGDLLMQEHSFHDLLADGHGRIERCHRILENHCDMFSVESVTDLFLRQFCHVDSFFFTLFIGEGIHDRAAVNFAVGSEDAHDGLYRDGFA